MPPPCGFSTSVGTRTSFVVTRIVGSFVREPGIACGGSTGGNCCACAIPMQNKNTDAASATLMCTNFILNKTPVSVIGNLAPEPSRPSGAPSMRSMGGKVRTNQRHADQPGAQVSPLRPGKAQTLRCHTLQFGAHPCAAWVGQHEP